MKMRYSIVLTLTLVGTALADWPQWRGPRRDGTSPEVGLLKEWPQGAPPLLWQQKDVGAGYAAPAVVGERIYLQANRGMADEFVQALSTADGKQLWTARLGKVGPNQGPQYPGARGTPTVDGSVLYALGSDGDLVCLETINGNERWRKNLRTDFGGKPGRWAYAESPLVDGDVIVVTPGGADATIVALDKTNGATRWQSAVPGGDEAAYASAIIVDAAGFRQYVQFLQNGLVGVEAKTGKFLWRYGKTAAGSPANIPTPVAQGDYVYSGTGKGGAGLVKLKPDQGGVAAEQVYYRAKDLPTAIGGAVLLDGHLYGTNNRGLMCVEFATGTVKWQDECVGAGSIVAADGRLYVFGEGNDRVALVEATPTAYREKGRFTPPALPQHSKEKAWAYPALSDGRLYLRDQGALWCYGVK